MQLHSGCAERFSLLGGSYLSEQEGYGSEGKGPAILVAEVGLIRLGSVQHLIIDVGDVQHQTNDQRET